MMWFLLLIFLLSGQPSPAVAAEPAPAGEILSGSAIGIADWPEGASRSEETRAQEDSELFRFALVAFFAVWASKTITQRRLR